MSAFYYEHYPEQLVRAPGQFVSTNNPKRPFMHMIIITRPHTITTIAIDIPFEVARIRDNNFVRKCLHECMSHRPTTAHASAQDPLHVCIESRKRCYARGFILPSCQEGRSFSMWASILRNRRKHYESLMNRGAHAHVEPTSPAKIIGRKSVITICVFASMWNLRISRARRIFCYCRPCTILHYSLWGTWYFPCIP